ncbi:MAG: nucleotidyltransferase domain-containing protein, partial [Deltaproteobacteria bacterium]|nr:nucleotidyltransferase domain-containing protein [Deltaproteobacteria bacterium]
MKSFKHHSDDPLLNEIVERLVNEFVPQKIYLFGSRAKGTGNDESDYDLLVVLAKLDKPTGRFSQRAYEA